MTDIKKTIRISPEIDDMVKELLRQRPELHTERQVIESAISCFYQKCTGRPFAEDELNYIFSTFAKSPYGKQIRLNCQESNILQKTQLNMFNSLLHSRQIANPEFLPVSALPHPLYTKSKNDVYEKIKKSTKNKEWRKGKNSPKSKERDIE